MKKDVLTRILAVLAALAVWQLAAMSVGSRILLATPWQALSRLLALLPTAGLWRTVGCSFVRITGAGLKESHVHDVTITREAPNYPTR